MSSQQSQRPSFIDTFLNDIRTSHAIKTLKKEIKEIADFYLTEDQRERIKKMNPPKRFIYIFGYVFKEMFYKLKPFRRLLFVLGIFFIITVRTSSGGQQEGGNALFGGILLVLLIILELKDKLLAHDELQEGRHIQELLMPERNPKIKGWSAWLFTRSANEVCGDLIDLIRTDDGRIGIAVADVAGKGLHAALLTTKLQSTIRALAFNEQSPAKLVHDVNTIFHRDSPSHIFASLFYLELREKGSSLQFVNAGHLPGLIMKNKAMEETGKGDTALGLMRTANFSQHSTKLKSGEFFIIYSDGLTEAKNETGEFFSKERLIQMVHSVQGTPEQIGNKILIEVDRFIGTTKASDDLSIVILQKQ